MYDRPSAKPSRYSIVSCYYCGNVLISRSTHRTKLCTYCHNRITLRNATVIAEAKTASEASQIAKAKKVEHPRK